MPLPPNLRCGPAGWSYPGWYGTVYPKMRSRGFHPLEFLASYFDTVEINSTFYQPARPEISRLWMRMVSANPRFLFTAKLQRQFTHERSLAGPDIASFKDGLWPLLRAGKLGCVLMQFPWTFRYTEENREYFIQLRRAFHEFPLVAEMRHSSWMQEEALGTLIDYRVGFCNIDQPQFTKAMPTTAFLTTSTGYVRLHGRDAAGRERDYPRSGATPAHEYLYTAAELEDWKPRIDQLAGLAANTFVIANNDGGGKAAVNALQISAMMGDTRLRAPTNLLQRYALELDGFRADRPLQQPLFEAYSLVA